MDTTDNHSTPARPSQENKPGQRALVLRVEEKHYRTFRSRAMALGMKNPDFFAKLVELEARHPVG